MAPGDVLNGRRVADNNVQAIEKPGDYSVMYAGDGAIASLWMAVPRSAVLWSRIAASGYGQKRRDGSAEPEWEIREDGDGLVTVSPSIDCRWGSSPEDRWHGYLEAGVWREV